MVYHLHSLLASYEEHLPLNLQLLGSSAVTSHRFLP